MHNNCVFYKFEYYFVNYRSVFHLIKFAYQRANKVPLAFINKSPPFCETLPRPILDLNPNNFPPYFKVNLQQFSSFFIIKLISNKWQRKYWKITEKNEETHFIKQSLISKVKYWSFGQNSHFGILVNNQNFAN